MSSEPTALVAELRSKVRGEIRFDDGSRGLYATDASNYRQVPIGVVIPRDADDVVAAIAACRAHGAPVLNRGGGTSLAGQCCNAAVVIDTSKYVNDIVQLDVGKRKARVEPGTILDTLRDAAEQHGLTFGPDPATHDHCTLGGMIGNNSCGVHSVMAGKTVDNIDELEILTYDGLRTRVGKTSEEELERIVRAGGRRGEIYGRLKALRDRYADVIRRRYPDIPRRVSGYNLDQLLPENGFHVARALVGSESTCVTVLEATARLVPSPRVRSLLVLGYPDVYVAADHVPDILAAGPIGLEGMDDRLVDYMLKKDLHPEDVKLLPDGGGWLLVEFGGEDEEEADEQAHALMRVLKSRQPAPSMKLFEDEREEEKVWALRESGLGATAFVPGERDTWPGWEDSAVPPDSLGGYLRDLRKLFDDYGYSPALYGHFGQACVHCRVDFELKSKDGIDRYHSFLHDAADLVVGYGGSFSGEHGDGQARGELLPKMFGEELMRAFWEFKSIWDPDWKMNPGKVIDADRATENLRLGAGYKPPILDTHFSFPEDEGSFAHATLRCVGVGKCRRHGGGTMCPSYMVTREEKHTTRGRARMLFEMLEGDPVRNGWRDDQVKESLELCLACKGCKSECPVDVDMATYKAEFYSHYYKRRLRPVQAYSLGLIYWWARVGSRAPGAVNFITHARRLAGLVKRLGGIAPERPAPRFAPSTFRQRFSERGRRGDGRRRVVLWPDTFNNHFHPQVADAAVDVLEAAGCSVELPPRPLCCGRPLYDYGMLPTAKRLLRQTLRVMRPHIAGGVPFVGLEPSCTAVFRDELSNLFPHDEDARRLADQFFTLSEFLEDQGFDPPPLRRQAVVHGHCHHKAIMGVDPDLRLLDKLALDYDLLDSGCCGLAGSFGFEKGEKFEISVKAGERVLLPAVRDAPNDALIITDGFSCQTQIAHLTDRSAVHIAEVIKMALDQQGRSSS